MSTPHLLQQQAAVLTQSAPANQAIKYKNIRHDAEDRSPYVAAEAPLIDELWMDLYDCEYNLSSHCLAIRKAKGITVGTVGLTPVRGNQTHRPDATYPYGPRHISGHDPSIPQHPLPQSAPQSHMARLLPQCA